jgi:hypothetical protein
MTKTIPTSMGPIQIIGFADFLLAMPHMASDAPTRLYRFNAQIQTEELHGQVTSEGLETTSTEATYQRASIWLLPNATAQDYLSQLVTQLSPYQAFKRPLRDILEDAAVASVCSYGIPTHLVRLAPRNWLLCNSSDFMLVDSPRGSGLAAYQRQKPRLVVIDRATEDEVMDNVKKAYSALIGTPAKLDEVRKNLRYLG